MPSASGGQGRTRASGRVDPGAAVVPLSQRIGLLVYDEVHTYRNAGANLNAAVAMSEISSSVIGLSATPIITRASVSVRSKTAVEDAV